MRWHTERVIRDRRVTTSSGMRRKLLRWRRWLGCRLSMSETPCTMSEDPCTRGASRRRGEGFLFRDSDLGQLAREVKDSRGEALYVPDDVDGVDATVVNAQPKYGFQAACWAIRMPGAPSIKANAPACARAAKRLVSSATAGAPLIWSCTSSGTKTRSTRRTTSGASRSSSWGRSPHRDADRNAKALPCSACQFLRRDR